MNDLIHFRNISDPAYEATAFSKAPSDICRIVHNLGFYDYSLTPHLPFFFGHQLTRIARMLQARIAPMNIPAGSIVFCQTPFPLSWSPAHMSFLRSVRRHGSFVVTLFHDIDAIRGIVRSEEDGLSTESRSFIRISDVIICHNARMSRWLVEHGANADRIVELELFDYLADDFRPPENMSLDRHVVIAGNLKLEKAGYLADIGTISDVEWRLFGPNYDPKAIQGPTVRHCGCFPPEEVPQHLTPGFGLVWDGPSIETCIGNFGNYLRLNTPHKLSLYLAAGLPVIVWEEAAVADFVRANRVGLTIRSLHDVGAAIANVSAGDLAVFKRNALSVSAKLRAGHYTRTAIEKARTYLTNRQT